MKCLWNTVGRYHRRCECGRLRLVQRQVLCVSAQSKMCTLEPDKCVTVVCFQTAETDPKNFTKTPKKKV